MNNTISFRLLTLAGILIFAPFISQAYTTTSQDAQKVTNTAALYSIEFSFGHEEHDTYIPIMALRNQDWGGPKRSLGYEVLINEDTTNETETLGIVTSNATITDDQMYFVPKGEAQKFTLYILQTNVDPTSLKDYSMLVSDLPFYWDEDRQYLRLNPSELQYYHTPTPR